MASISYGMGQLRFNSGYSYVTSKKHEGKKEDGFDSIILVKVPPTTTTTAETQCWRDYVMDCEAALGGKLSSNTTYLLKLSIPKDENYDCDFNVKLIDSADSSIGTQATGYQVIRYLHVPAAGSNQKNSRIVLYPVIKNVNTNYQPWAGEGEKADQPRVAIALDYQDLSAKYQTSAYNYDAGTVFYNSGNQRSTSGDSPTVNSEYAVMENGGEQLPTWENISSEWKILNKNDTILNWTWEIEDHSSEAVNFNIIFKPKTDTYSRIWVEMSRGGIDWDIFDGTSIGRTIDVSPSGNFSAELFTLAELTSSTAPLPEGITNIGLHSHPNLLFAINGEEIRVGQSGYYELNDFDITSFNIAATDKKDYFVLDYQYKVTS